MYEYDQERTTFLASHGDEFSAATLKNARLNFDDTLYELSEVLNAFESNPRFSVSIDLCLAIRTAWLKAFGEWVVKGDVVESRLREMRNCLERGDIGLKTLHADLLRTGSLEDADKVKRFCDNTERRLWPM